MPRVCSLYRTGQDTGSLTAAMKPVSVLQSHRGLLRICLPITSSVLCAASGFKYTYIFVFYLVRESRMGYSRSCTMAGRKAPARTRFIGHLWASLAKWKARTINLAFLNEGLLINGLRWCVRPYRQTSSEAPRSATHGEQRAKRLRGVAAFA